MRKLISHFLQGAKGSENYSVVVIFHILSIKKTWKGSYGQGDIDFWKYKNLLAVITRRIDRIMKEASVDKINKFMVPNLNNTKTIRMRISCYSLSHVREPIKN